MASLNLRHTFTADGDSPVIDWPGGLGIFAGRGTAGGGTYTLMHSDNGGFSYFSADGATSDLAFTAEDRKEFTADKGKLKVTASGSTSPSFVVTVRPA